jgi:Chaperone of endosialidase
MKKVNLVKVIRTEILCVFCVMLINNIQAQIKVNPSGELKINNERPNNDYNNDISVEIFGMNANNPDRPGGKISFGDYGSAQYGSCNVYLGEYGVYDSDVLELHGNRGIKFTTRGSFGTDNAVTIEQNGNLMAIGDVFARWIQLTSDVRLKKNIKNMNNALASVIKLQGITYDLNSTKEDTQLAALNAITPKEVKDKNNIDNAKKDIEQRKLENLNNIGFSAQEVQKIFPQLVKTDNEGFLSVNYVALIPVAIEALKEQQAIIEFQRAEIENLKKDVTAIKKKLGM